MSDPDRRNATASSLDEDIVRGRACYAGRAWDDAYQALSRADLSGALALDDLERLTWSSGLTGRDDEFLKLLERAHQAQLDAGAVRRAARFAFWLTLRLFARGETGRASGWMARAQRLVEHEGEGCAEQGYLLVPMIFHHRARGEHEAAYAIAARAGEIGERCGEPDLIALARGLQGRALASQGQIERAVALIDEVMLAATQAELSPLVTGLIYCTAIGCLQEVYAFDRAREWTSLFTSWCAAQPQLVTFAGMCLVHRAEILQLGGAWPEAICEAQRAVERSAQTVDRFGLSDAYYQQAEIHRMRGELEAAEEAYRQANQHGREPQPGLALLRALQGRNDAATAAIRRTLTATTDPLTRARFLPACVEIMLAAGELDEARAAAAELEQIAANLGTEVPLAMAAHARAAVRLAEGDAQAALEPLRRALAVWQRLQAPYLAARIRVLLGRACLALGDHDGAALELDAARAVFEQLGAAPDLAALAAQVAPAAAPPASRHGLSERELQVLRLIAAGKTNRAIARELHLSEKTVDRHASNIFAKIDVPSRAAATAFAYEHGLI